MATYSRGSTFTITKHSLTAFTGTIQTIAASKFAYVYVHFVSGGTVAFRNSAQTLTYGSVPAGSYAFNGTAPNGLSPVVLGPTDIIRELGGAISAEITVVEYSVS